MTFRLPRKLLIIQLIYKRENGPAGFPAGLFCVERILRAGQGCRGYGRGFFEYGNILEFLRLLLHKQWKSGTDARFSLHCARMRIADDTALFVYGMQ